MSSIKIFSISTIFLLLITGCSSNIKLIEERSSNTNISSSTLTSEKLIPDSFKQTFKKEIAFWKDIYNKHTWTDVIYYTPVTPEIIEIIKVTFIKHSEDPTKMGVSLISPSLDKLLIVDNKTPEELFFNSMNIPEVKEELDTHYDYLNEEFQKRLSKKETQIGKDIGMTRGRKDWYEEKFASCNEYLDFAKKTFSKNNIPSDIAFLALVESGCTPTARSSQDAVGILQMIEDTARKNGLIVNESFDERLDPVLETQGSMKYISKLIEEFENPLWAINAYHSGEGNLRKAKKWAETNYPDLNTDEQYEKVIQAFPDDDEFNTEEIYFYGKNSALYTILFASMLEVYEDWSEKNTPIKTSKWWSNLDNRYTHTVSYPEKIIKTTYKIQSGDTLTTIANKHFLSLDLLRVQLEDENPYLIAGQELEFSYPKTYTLKEYLDIKEKTEMIENKESFCKKNPSVKDCLSRDIEILIVENGTRIFD